MDVFGIDIAGFLSVVASAGVLSAFVSWGLQAFVASRGKRQRANYLLLQLSVAFQAYSSERLRECGLHDVHESSGGHAGDHIGPLPAIPPFPDMPDVWPLIDTKLADRALQFNVLVAQRNADRRDYFDVVGDLDFDEVVLDHLEMGYQAIILSRDLRYNAGLGQAAVSQKMAEGYPPLLSAIRSKLIAASHP